MAGQGGAFGGGASGNSSPGGADKRSAEEMAAVMGRINASIQGANQSFMKQLEIIQQLKGAMGEAAGSIENMARVSPSAVPTAQWQQAANDLKTLAAGGEKASDVFKKLSEFMNSKFAKSMAIATGGLSGLKAGFGASMAGVSALTGVLGSLIGTLFEVGAAILSIPFKMLSGLFEMAQGGGGGGGGGLAEALEGIRAKFGDLKGPMSQATFNVGKMEGHFKMAGLTALRAFGPLPERVKKATEAIVAMGNASTTLQADIENLADGILAFNSGLGITNEMMPGIATWVTKTGQSMTDLYVDITKQSKKMAAAMGINAKVMSTDMAKAMQDAAHFGHMSTTALAAVAGYTQKLGISLDKLTGMMDQFSTFDQAAESASQLNSALGTNIDTMELMNAQADGSQLDYLRKQFSAAGKDIGKMDFYTRKLVSSATGLDQATLDQAFGVKNAAVQMSDFKDAADQAAKSTMTTDQALKALTNDIQRFVGGGGGGDKPKTFWEAFIKGFGKSINNMKEFKQLMLNIQKDFIIVEKLGKDIGDIFKENFPGFKQMVTALRDMFDPAKFRKLADQIKGIFKDFLDPNNPAYGNVDTLFDKIKKGFLDFFDSQSSAGKSFLDGFKKFTEFFVKIFSRLMVIAIEGLADVINWITNWIKNPDLPDAGGAVSEWGKILAPLKDVFKAASEKLWPAIKEFAGLLFAKIGNAIADFARSESGKKVLMVGFAILFGPAILGAVLGAIASSLIQGIASLLTASITKAFGSKGPMDAVQQGASSLQKAAQKVPAAGGQGVANTEAAIPKKSLADKLREIGDKNPSIAWKEVFEFFTALAGLMLIFAGTFALSALMMAKVPTGGLVKAGLVFLAMAFLMPKLAKMVEEMDKIKKFNLKQVSLQLAAIGLVLLVGIGAFAIGLMAVKGVPLGDLIKVGILFAIMLGVFYATVPLMKAASEAGKQAQRNKSSLIVGMVTLGLALVEIILVMALAVKMLGKTSASELGMTVVTLAVGGIMFGAVSLLIPIAAKAGKVAEKNKSNLIVGMLTLGLSLLAIAGVMRGIVGILGTVTGSQLLMASVTMVAAGAMFAAMTLAMPFIVDAGKTANKSKGDLFAGMLSLSISLLAIAGVMKGIVSILGSVTGSQLQMASAAMVAAGAMFAAMTLALPEIVSAGKVANKSKSNLIVGMISLSLSLLAISGVMLGVVKMLGSISVGELGTAMLVMVAAGILFGAMALALPGIAAAGKLAQSQAANLAIGMLALGISVLTIAGTMWLVVKMLGGFSIGQVGVAVAATVAMGIMFMAVLPVIVLATLIGAAVIASAGVGAGALAIGLAAMAISVMAIAGTAWVVIKLLGGIPPAEILKAAVVMTVFTALFAAMAILIPVAALVGALVMFAAGPLIVGMLAMAGALIAIAGVAMLLVTMTKNISVAQMITAGAVISITTAAMLAAAALLAVAALVGVGVIAAAAPILAGMAAMAIAMLAVAGVAYVIIKATSSISIDQLQHASKVLGVTSAMLIATAAMLAVAGAVGLGVIAFFVPLVAGMAAMWLGMEAVAGLAGSMVESTKGIKADQVETASSIIGTTALAMAKIGLLLVEATAAGALAVGSLGGTFVGIDAMKQMANTVMEFAKTLLQEASASTMSPETVKQRIEPIIAVITGVASFMKTISEAGKVGDFGSFDGKALEKMVTEGIRLMKGIIGGENDVGTITDLINKSKNIGSVQAEGLKGIGAIVSGVAQMMASLTGPIAELRKGSGMIEQFLTGGDKLEVIIEKLKPFILDTIKELGPLAQAVAGAVGSLGNAKPESLKEGAAAISAVLGGLGGLAGNLKPADVKLENLDKIPPGTSITINNSAPKITDILDSLKTHVPTLIDTLTDTVKKVPSDKGFKEKIQIMGSMFTFLKDLTGALKGATTDIPQIPGAGYVNSFKALMEPVVGILKLLLAGEGYNSEFSIATIAKLIDKAAAGVTKDSAANGKKLAEFVKGLADTMSGLKEAGEALKGAGGEGEGGGDTLDKAWPKVSKQMGDVLDAMAKGDTSLVTLGTKINALGKFDKNAGQRMTDVATSISSIGEALNTISSSFSGIDTTLTALAASTLSVKEKGLTSITSAVESASQISAKVAELSGVLGGIKSLSIDKVFPKLASLAAGAGGQASATIKASNDVTIKLDLTVHLDPTATSNAIAHAEGDLKAKINSIINYGVATQAPDELADGLKQMRKIPALSKL